ncbi:phosphoenolpyruvate-utilizing N-terminal domain-containing protein, partial [Acidihalobacter prosperus]
MSLLLNGIGVSRGIAIGRAHLYQQQTPEVTEKRLPHDTLNAEIKRFRHALRFARREFTLLRKRIPDSAPADFSSFIDTYVLMLEDKLLAQTPVQLIRDLRCNAEWALKTLHDELVATFDVMEDPYLKTRRDDVTHVIEKLQRILTNQQYTSEPEKGEIILARNLSAAEIADLHEARVSGIITEFGGPLSHAAILMRSLAIPAVVGAANALQLINNGETLILDGESGFLVANVPPALQQHYRKKQQTERKRRATLDITPHYPSITRDGTLIALQANIELNTDLAVLRRQESTDVGLYRTEFLYANYDHPPDEAEQLKVYRKALRALRGKSLTIRTCDMGGDKLFGT